MRTVVTSIARAASVGAAALLALAVAAPGAAQPAATAAYPQRAPLAEYMMAADAEIALARSAAPAALAQNADVMVLGERGYRTAVRGTNGFVCLVWRSWSDDFGDDEFWNPKVRAPICMNPIAVRTVLPGYMQRTGWALAGLGKAEMRSRFEAAIARHQVQTPGPGAMSYMMSREGHLADAIGHASPHIMFFVPRAERQDWGANLKGSPIAGADGPPDPVALFFVTVPRWSDGTPAMAH